MRRWLLDFLAPGWREQRCARASLAQAVRWLGVVHRLEHAAGEDCALCEFVEYVLHVQDVTRELG